MCNNYQITSQREAVRELVKALRDLGSNETSRDNVFPDYLAPIVREQNAERVLANARWGLPSPAFALNVKTHPTLTLP